MGRRKTVRKRLIYSLIIACATMVTAFQFGMQDTYAASKSMNVNEWLSQCKSICVKIANEKAVYSSKGCPTAYFDKNFRRSKYGKKTRLHCADYASWCLQRYKIIPAGKRFWVRGQQVKGVNGGSTSFVTKNKKIQRINIAKKGIPASTLVKRSGTKSLKKGDLVSVVRKSGSGNHIQIYAGKENGKMIFYMVSSIATTHGKGTRLTLEKMTTQSRDPYSKDPRIAMILRIKGLDYTDYFKVTTSAGSHGSIDKSRNVKWGTNATFKITPEKGYRINTLKVDGKAVKITKTATSYTIKNVKSKRSISVTFERDPNVKPETGFTENMTEKEGVSTQAANEVNEKESVVEVETEDTQAAESVQQIEEPEIQE